MRKTLQARTLVLARHARAENHASSDEARELSEAGHAGAAAMGRWLVGAGHNVDLVVSSAAVRTRQTWSDIEAAGVSAHEVWFDARVYGADADQLLEVLADSPDRMRTILVIGHAPTIPELAVWLADPEGSDRHALAALRSACPPGCLAMLSLDTNWADLGPGGATLTAVATPTAD